MDILQEEVEKRMLEDLRKTSEENYLENPNDVDNLTRWSAALLELSKYSGDINDTKNMIREAVSKLEEVLTINPAKHDALWCLGNAHSACAFLTSDHDEAKILLDEAFQCFQKAVDESPETEHYLKSLAACAKAPALHKEIHTQGGLGQAQQTLGGGPAASLSATGSAKNKSSDLKYAFCGWVILAVGFFTWVGIAKSQVPPPPAR